MPEVWVDPSLVRMMIQSVHVYYAEHVAHGVTENVRRSLYAYEIDCACGAALTVTDRLLYHVYRAQGCQCRRCKGATAARHG